MGTAEIILPNRRSALRAAEIYNNVSLDNSTMNVTVKEYDFEDSLTSCSLEDSRNVAKKGKDLSIEELGNL